MKKNLLTCESYFGKNYGKSFGEKSKTANLKKKIFGRYCEVPNYTFDVFVRLSICDIYII